MVNYNHQFVTKRSVEHVRRFAQNRFPDIITIGRKTTGASVDSRGVLTYSPERSLIPFNGDNYVPCRFDLSRTYRPSMTRVQEVNINEQVLYLPVGVDIRPDDKLTYYQPVDLTTNDKFLDGLTGWGETVTGASAMTLVEQGATFEFGNNTDTLFEQTIDPTYTGSLLLLHAIVEVREGTLRISTPFGDLDYTAGTHQRVHERGVHAGGDLAWSSPTGNAVGHVARLGLQAYKLTKVFEARRILDAGDFRTDIEVTVQEMEFAHTDD